jgi:cytochrome P450
MIDFGFGCRRAVFDPLLGDGIFTQDGDAWRESRENLRKVLRGKLHPVLERLGDFTDSFFADLPRQRVVVDLQPLFFKLTLDITMFLFLGTTLDHSFEDGANIATSLDFARSFDIAQEGLEKRFRIAPWHVLYNPLSFRRACATVRQVVEKFIHQHQILNGKGSGSSSGFVTQLAQELPSDARVRDQVINILLASRDTTASCLTWTVYVHYQARSSFRRLTWTEQLSPGPPSSRARPSSRRNQRLLGDC